MLWSLYMYPHIIYCYIARTLRVFMCVTSAPLILITPRYSPHINIPALLQAAVKRTSDTSLTFTVTDSCAAAVTLIPLSEIMNEKYVVYW